MKSLSQTEADTLRKIEKYLLCPKDIRFPPPQGTKLHPIAYTSNERKMTNMKLSTFHATKNPKKVSYRIIYNNSVMLVRIDTQDATPHYNPDKTHIAPYQPHIHIYHEIYGDKFAYPLPDDFSKTDDISNLLMEFLSYSNIININEVELYVQEVLIDDY